MKLCFKNVRCKWMNWNHWRVNPLSIPKMGNRHIPKVLD
jgi:hypothetical protein